MPSHSPTEASEDDDGEGGEQREHPRPLPARLGAADDRREEETARHPGGGDPEDGELEVEGPQQVVGEEPREVETVEGSRLDAIVGESAPGQGLEQEQERDDAEVERGRPLARGQGPARESAVVRLPARRRAVPAEVVEPADGEQDGAQPGEQGHEAQRAPQVRGRARPIADRRLVGPVVRVGVVLPGAVRDRRPGRPREVRVEVPELARVADVPRGQPWRGPGAREVLGPLPLLRLPGRRLGRREAQGAGGGVVAVLLEQAVDGGVEARGRVRVELRVGPAVALTGESVPRDFSQPVQVFRAVVRAEVRPVTPESAVLHETVLEEDLLPVLDALPGEERRPVGAGHPLGDGRGVRVGEDGHHREHAEAERHHENDAVAPPGR